MWLYAALAAAAAPGPSVELELFHREGCARCAEAQSYLAELQSERPWLHVTKWDVGRDAAARARLETLLAQHPGLLPGVPAFHVRGQLLVGFGGPASSGRQLRALVDGEDASEEDAGAAGAAAVCPQQGEAPCPPPGAADAETIDAPWVGRVSARELGLPAFTVLIGLLDGFNPCAMWVLLFLLSLLVNLRDRRRMLLVGGTFVLTSGLVYFLFMAAWLNLFLALGLSRAVQAVLGLVALTVGALNTKDFFAFKRGPSLSIPERAKPGLYARTRRLLQQRTLLPAMGGVVVLALLVNLVELACTAGLPAVYTQILTLRRLPTAAYYGYLALYNVAYVLDDSVMLAIAVVTLGRRKLQERAGRGLKLVSGLVMLALGLLLLLRPGWLVF